MRKKYPYFDAESMKFDESKRPAKKVVEIQAEDIIENKINIRDYMERAEKENFIIKIINSIKLLEPGNRTLLNSIFELGLRTNAGFQFDLPRNEKINIDDIGFTADKEAIKKYFSGYIKSDN